MFGKNKNNSNVSHDIDVMMQMMDKVIQGEYDEIDVTAFDNPAYGEKLNELIHAFKKSNNNFVMRLNEAMESIGDNSYVKNTAKSSLFERFEKAKEQIIWFLAQGVSIKNLENIAL